MVYKAESYFTKETWDKTEQEIIIRRIASKLISEIPLEDLKRFLNLQIKDPFSKDIKNGLNEIELKELEELRYSETIKVEARIYVPLNIKEKENSRELLLEKIAMIKFRLNHAKQSDYIFTAEIYEDRLKQLQKEVKQLNKELND